MTIRKGAMSPCTPALGSGNDQPAPRGSRRHSCGAPIVRARLARPFWGDCRRPRRYPQTRTTRQQFQLPFGTPDLYEVGSSTGRVNDWLPRRMAAYSTLLRLDTDFDQNVKNLPCLAAGQPAELDEASIDRDGYHGERPGFGLRTNRLAPG